MYASGNAGKRADLGTLRCLIMNENTDALPSDAFTCAQKRSRAKMEDTVYQLPDSVHTVEHMHINVEVSPEWWTSKQRTNPFEEVQP